MCKKPFKQGVAEFGCGQCLPCRINRLRLWTLRLILEATQAEASFFVTLTYAQEHYPSTGEVSVRELQLFNKKLRRLFEPGRLRYYCVGEYGERTQRAHYHGIFFLSLPCELESFKALCTKAWGKGFVHVGSVSPASIAYVVSYVCKRMTKADDKRLNGKHPEFARMSLRPHGLGAGSLGTLASAIEQHGARYRAQHGDIPTTLRFDGKILPIGRYLAEKLRGALGIIKKRYVRGQEPLKVHLLLRQLEAADKSRSAAREVRRQYQARRAEQRLRDSQLRKVL